jgi:hypothetical protein
MFQFGVATSGCRTNRAQSCSWSEARGSCSVLGIIAREGALFTDAYGHATGQFGTNHLGDRDAHLPTVHGFDEYLGNLYHMVNVRADPYEKAPTEAGMYIRWYGENIWLFVPVQQKLKAFLLTIPEFPFQVNVPWSP